MQETFQADAAMTPDEMQACLSEPITRGEAIQLMREYTAYEASAQGDGILAFLLRFIRFMFGASGCMQPEQFDKAFAAFAEQFEQRFGNAGATPETPEDAKS